MIHDDQFWELLARYFANEATPDERRLVDNWITASEANRQLFARMQQLWTLPGSTALPESNPAEVWNQRIASRLEETNPPIVRPLGRSGWASGSWRVAAAVAGLLLAFFALYQYRSSGSAQHQVAQNPAGKRSLIRLPDGSRVWLNADSRLEFPKKFDGPLREVRLVGEAFFDVTHKAQQPFIIRLKTASIRVLGTSFNVRAYPGDAVVKTTVVTGRVAFVPHRRTVSGRQSTTPGDTLFVLPNHHVVQKVQTLAVAEEPVIAQKEAAWKDNRLLFDQTPIAEVAQTLERWYGVKVTLERPELANCPLTATFEGQSLREVADLMSRTDRFQYTLTGAGLTIRGKGCQELTPP